MQQPLLEPAAISGRPYINSPLKCQFYKPTDNACSASEALDNDNVNNSSHSVVEWVNLHPNPSWTKLFQLQSELTRLGTHDTMSYCMKSGYENIVSIGAKKGKVKIRGTTPCKSPLCINCTRRKADKEAQAIQLVLNQAHKEGLDVHFPSFTHNKTLSVEKATEMTRRGRTSLNTYLNNKKNRQGIEAIAYWVVEDTFDRVPVPTGNDYTTRTHNHLHVLVIFLTKLTEAQQTDFLEGMREAWINAIRKAGGYTSREKAMYCVRIDTGRESSSRISEYITKTISSAHSDAEKAKSGKLKLELTHHFNKRGQGRSIIELLRDIKRRGWECDVKAYRFLIRANKGKPRSYGNRAWNRYLERAKLLAEDEDDQSEPEIALIDPEVGLTRFDGEHGEVRTLEEFIGGWKAGEVDVKVSFTKVMLGHIVRSGAFFHLLELVSKASVGVHLELFQEFKEYCRSNPFWGDKNLKRTPVRLQLDEQMSRWKEQIYV